MENNANAVCLYVPGLKDKHKQIITIPDLLFAAFECVLLIMFVMQLGTYLFISDLFGLF